MSNERQAFMGSAQGSPEGPSITDLKPVQSWHSAVIHRELRRRFYVCRDVPPDFCLLCIVALVCVFFFAPSKQTRDIVCQFPAFASVPSRWDSCHTLLDATACHLPRHFWITASTSSSSSSSLKVEMPLVCERLQVNESETSRSNISSSNMWWHTQTPEHDCWIENCWELEIGIESLYRSEHVSGEGCMPSWFLFSFFAILSAAFSAQKCADKEKSTQTLSSRIKGSLPA